MKYKLLKEFPGYPIGYIFESSTFPQFDVFNVKAYPDFFEEVKEHKTIYDLKEGDKYYLLDDGNEVTKYEVPNNNYFNSPFYRFICFVTEREAKRNKFLRELATRTDKWLPDKGGMYYTVSQGCKCMMTNFTTEGDILNYHSGLVFRNEEEYNKYITEEAKDLLFKL